MAATAAIEHAPTKEFWPESQRTGTWLTGCSNCDDPTYGSPCSCSDTGSEEPLPLLSFTSRFAPKYRDGYHKWRPRRPDNDETEVLSLQHLCCKLLSGVIFPLHQLNLSDQLVRFIERDLLVWESNLVGLPIPSTVEISFSVDLVAESASYLRLMEAIDKCPLLADPAFLKKAFRRTGRYLALKAKTMGRLAAVPLDIACVLGALLTRNDVYQRFCSDYSALVDFYSPLVVFDAAGSIVAGHMTLEDIETTRTLYRTTFGEELHFNLEDVAKNEVQPLPSFLICKSRSTDKQGWHLEEYITEGAVLEDRAWLPGFLATVGARSVDEFLESGPARRRELLLRYQGFMAASRSSFSEFRMPWELDLIWHTHLMFPRCYHADFARFVGRLFFHHPWPRAGGERRRKKRTSKKSTTPTATSTTSTTRGFFSLFTSKK